MCADRFTHIKDEPRLTRSRETAREKTLRGGKQPEQEVWKKRRRFDARLDSRKFVNCLSLGLIGARPHVLT